MRRIQRKRLSGTVLLLAGLLSFLTACQRVDAPGRTSESTSASTSAETTTEQASEPSEPEFTIHTTTETSGSTTPSSEPAESEEPALPSASIPAETDPSLATPTPEASEATEPTTTEPTEPTTTEIEPTTPVSEPTSPVTTPTSEASNANTGGDNWLDDLGDLLSGITAPPSENGEPVPGTQDAPVPLGEVGVFDGSSTLFDRYEASLRITEIIRGDQAAGLVQMASRLNPTADEGHEYLLARIEIAVTDLMEQEQIDIGPYSFTLVSAEGDPYASTMLIRQPDPVFEPFTDTETQSAYVVFQVSIEDSAPKLVFLARNYGGLWFETVESELDYTSLSG